ncbi:Hypothetical_protein [Hexamita inflata]|uniref:Hypothetical_protein n=1 Tax=Hexamita inflata TaxID=28002 RepID=A0ABP1KH32_9EUKA
MMWNIVQFRTASSSYIVFYLFKHYIPLQNAVGPNPGCVRSSVPSTLTNERSVRTGEFREPKYSRFFVKLNICGTKTGVDQILRENGMTHLIDYQMFKRIKNEIEGKVKRCQKRLNKKEDQLQNKVTFVLYKFSLLYRTRILT